MEIKKNISKYIDSTFLRNVENNISEATALKFFFLDNEGEFLNDQENHWICDCLESKESICVLKKALKKNGEKLEGMFSFKCPSGLIHLGVPVLLNKEKIAFLIGGEFTIKKCEAIAKDNFNEIKVLSKDKYEKASKMMELSSGVFSSFMASMIPKIKRENKLDFLENYSQLVREKTTLEEIARVGLVEGALLLEATKGAIFIIEENQKLKLLTSIGFDREKLETGGEFLEEILVRHVLKSNKPVILKKRVKKSWMSKVVSPTLKDAICVSLKVKEEVLGMIVVSGLPESKSFKEKDLNFLSMVGTQIGIAFYNTKLSEQLERKIMELSTLFDMSKFVTSEFDPEEIINSLLIMVNHIVRVSFCFLKIFNKRNNDFTLDSFWGLEKEEVKEIIMHPFIQKSIERVRESHKPLLIRTEVESIKKKHEINKVLLLPLVVKDKLNGILELYLDKNVEIKESEIALLVSLINQSSIMVENSRLYQNLKEHFLKTVGALASCVEAKDPYTKGHSVRVSAYSSMTADELSLSSKEVEDIQIAAVLHDIGKIGLAEEILQKPSKLNKKEYSLVKKHPSSGFKIIKPLNFSNRIKKAVLYHHENIDGKGYPEGLKNGQIPIEAKIIRVADSYDAMTTERTHRGAMKEEVAMKELVEGIDKHYDKDVVEAFIRVIKRKEIIFEHN
ncbi:MAG: HD domain-containing protein [Actinomycetia bacterium]|nr:HD domain-containing protein [Actinomycetes bacterium]